jgi:hypothetical protein
MTVIQSAARRRSGPEGRDTAEALRAMSGRGNVPVAPSRSRIAFVKGARTPRVLSVSGINNEKRSRASALHPDCKIALGIGRQAPRNSSNKWATFSLRLLTAAFWHSTRGRGTSFLEKAAVFRQNRASQTRHVRVSRSTGADGAPEETDGQNIAVMCATAAGPQLMWRRCNV